MTQLRHFATETSRAVCRRPPAGCWALYEDALAVRYAERTVAHYLADVRFLLAWLEERGVALVDVSTPISRRTRRTSVLSGRGTARPYRRARSRPSHRAEETSSASSTGGGTSSRPGGGRRAGPCRESASADRAHRRRSTPSHRGTAGADARRAARPGDPGDALRHGAAGRASSPPDAYDVDTEDRLLRVVMGKGRKDRNVL